MISHSPEGDQKQKVFALSCLLEYQKYLFFRAALRNVGFGRLLHKRHVDGRGAAPGQAGTENLCL